jgi:transketolase
LVKPSIDRHAKSSRAEAKGAPIQVESAAKFFEVLAAKRDDFRDLCVVTADMGPATRADTFQRAWPDAFYDVGIAEQDMVGFACGLTLASLVPVVTSASILVIGRAWEQIRNMADRGGYNVKFVGTGSGLTNTRHSLGLTSLEDLALLGGLQKFEIYSPYSADDIVAVVDRMVETVGPTYVRLGKYDLPAHEGVDAPFAPIRAHGDGDVAVVTTGFLVANALRAQTQLMARGYAVKVVNLLQIAPFPREEMLELLGGVTDVVVYEDHVPVGGIASRIALMLLEARSDVAFMRVGPERFDRCIGGLAENLDHHAMSDEILVRRIVESLANGRSRHS